MLSILFVMIGLWVSVLLNALADDWPRREPLSWPHCPNPECSHHYAFIHWLGISRLMWDSPCPECNTPTRKRVVLVEVATAVIFATMPLFFSDPATLVLYSFYMAIFILIIVIDLENRLILDIVTYPGTILALLASVVLPNHNWLSALLGAVIGFVIFLGIYWLAKVTFGQGAIGQGDVKLAMMMGAILGVPSILSAIIIGIALGGVISGFLLVTRLVNRNTYLPYGQYLAIAAMIMMVWGPTINTWWLE